MFKAIRISILLLVLLFVVLNTWLTQKRSTDWNNSLRMKVYPINADGSAETARYIASLSHDTFADIEDFMRRETERYGSSLERPVRVALGEPISDQPPKIEPDASVFGVMLWSLKMRWWVSSATSDQDSIEPDVSMFVRYHSEGGQIRLENSLGVQKGMYGIVNAYAGRRYAGTNNVIIAHELIHTLGGTDKYEPGSGQPQNPDGLAEPQRKPLYPQRYAEIMGGRVALAADDAVIPKSLKYAVIGDLTAREIRLTD